MNKLKKIFTSIGLFFTGISLKLTAFGVSTDKIQTKYGIFLNPEDIQDKYGVFEPINTTTQNVTNTITQNSSNTITNSSYSNSSVANFEVNQFATKYGVDVGTTEPSLVQKIASIGRFAVPVVLFCIGIFVLLSTKLSLKVKAIAVTSLAVLAVAGYFLMDYLANNM